MNTKKKQDLRFGNYNERIIHNNLEKYFGKLLNTADKYGTHYEFDKYNDKYLIEIKSRRINHNQYKSLMFGSNKYKKGKELLKDNPELRIFYIWNCLDGCYYWEHDTTEFTEELSGRRDRGKIEEDMCVHIDTKHLLKLDELILN